MVEPKFKFRTQYDRVRIFCDSGSPIKIKYEGRIDRDGKLEIVESGKEDLAAYINSFKDSCDINVIVKRFCNGDVSALSQRQGIYADLSDMPKTYAEMLDKIVQAEQIFDKLPLDVKSKFNNSSSEFIASFGSQDWLEKMSVTSDNPVDSDSKEVVTDES